MDLHAILTTVFLAIILVEGCLILFGIGEILCWLIWEACAYAGSWCWVQLENLLYALVIHVARLERQRRLRLRKELDDLPD